ncbi:GNAT family N-acetyltransferase [Phaeodactylibacter sp.]|jgi:ElaA protein|uniref:GNAT family N-acetyltransferase n=1 Tax=Phaeodactylibacter sp. TaxID=1940289 RepID=UPI0025F36FD2|nr:GNAT family N-acetyltransferase [Phaeodactylibacter sp.]MCI4651320.1 GNAT family N-acetyltransferase [Phaeodactylibacter sp.]MCI5090247.1 GNAT family N-acetyltransferase [Phaeodactylibacter sp.]
MTTSISFNCLPFEKLSLQELYDSMALRQEVFVVEQNCPYLDADGKDEAGHHLLGYNTDGKLMAYTRLLPPGISYPDYASIGRVVTSPSARRTGAGKILMRESIGWCARLYGEVPIKISAQVYLTHFYESFGFEKVGAEYLEDDIPHVGMVLG